MKLSSSEYAIMIKNVFHQHLLNAIPFYQREFPDPNTLHLRSHIQDVSRACLQRFYGDENSAEKAKEAIARQILYVNPKTASLGTLDLKAFLDEGARFLGYDQNLYGFHLLDLCYVETVCARRITEILNGTDAAFETFLPYNMRAILEISYSFPLDKRKDGYLERELINRNWPIMNFYPISSQLNLYEEWKKQRQKPKS